MVIDIHVHLALLDIYPQYWLNGIIGNMFSKIEDEDKRKKLSESFLKKTLNDYNCDKLVKSMDKAGITHSVVVIADFDYAEDKGSSSLEELYKRHHLSINKHMDRLHLFGGCDPRRGNKGYDSFEKGIKTYGFKGLKLYPPCGFEINDPLLYPLYDICSAKNLPVLFHVGPSLPEMKNRFDYPNSLHEICSAYKSINFIFGHGAILRYDDCNMIAAKHKNAYLELSGFQYLFTRQHDLASKLKHLMNVCPEQVVFGTDWPLFNDQKKSVEYILQSDYLTDIEKEKILYGNVSKIIQV